MDKISYAEDCLREHDARLDKMKDESKKQHALLDSYTFAKRALMENIKKFYEVYDSTRVALNISTPTLFPEEFERVTPATLAEHFVECFPYMDKELMAFIFNFVLEQGANKSK